MEIKLAWSGPIGQLHNQCTISINKDELIEIISASLQRGLYGSEEVPGGMDGLFAIAQAIMESNKESCECECHNHNGHSDADPGDTDD